MNTYSDEFREQHPVEYEQTRLVMDCATDLKNLLKDSGMPQAALAQRMGKSRAIISRQLSGDYNISLAKLAELAYHLGRRFVFKLQSLTMDGSQEGAVMTEQTRSSEFEGRTPCDWEAIRRDEWEGLPDLDMDFIVVLGHGDSERFVVPKYTQDVESSDAVTIANANMLAAGPKLLRQRDELVGVLEYIRGVCLTAHPRNEDGAGEHIIDTITAALAAVEGE